MERTVTGMAEYIDKEALMKKIDAWEESARNGTNPNCKNGNEYEAAMDIAIMVEEAPAADVRENVIRTQGDKLRAMSDEELATWIARVDWDAGLKMRPLTEYEMRMEWLDWLRQEVDDGDS